MAWQQFLHIHVYKNAGSTMDWLFKDSFGVRFVKFDPGPPGSVVDDAIWQEIRRQHNDAIGFSSHKVNPDLDRCIADKILPIIMLRHPIDRVRSTYDFENRERPSRSPSQHFAAAHTFTEWLNWHLDRPGAGAIGNFQTHRLRGISSEKTGYAFRIARGVLYKCPFIGIVERFEDSVDLLRFELGRKFKLQSRYKTRNKSKGRPSSLSDRLEVLLNQIDDNLCERLVSALDMDLALYAEAINLFHERRIKAGFRS